MLSICHTNLIQYTNLKSQFYVWHFDYAGWKDFKYLYLMDTAHLSHQWHTRILQVPLQLHQDVA